MRDEAAGRAPDGPDPRQLWRDALLAAALVAVDPHGLGGAAVRARHGPVREAWLAALARLLPVGTETRRIPPHVADDRLLGGLDLGATLASGRPVALGGLLTETDGGLAILPMAERADPQLVGRLAAALDEGVLRTERDGLSALAPARIGVVALDEGDTADERLAPALDDRLAFRLDLDGLPAAVIADSGFGPADVAAAREALGAIELDDAVVSAMVGTATACGIVSLRAPILAVRAARTLLALHGPAMRAEEAAEIAARLVLAPRALCLPADPDAEPEEPPPDPPDDTPDPPEETDSRNQPDVAELADRVTEAVRAALPADLLMQLAGPAATARQTPAGRAGIERRTPDRGRPIGARRGQPGGRARLDLIETLRAAAPWQPLRRRTSAAAVGVAVRPEDFRIRRFKRRSGTATIFAVDASGSAAAARLGEAKGAVEHLLAEAYVRRDQVGLVAFRGTGAEVLLPLTQSPALAKARLAALPGGGGTPVAHGLEAALRLALQAADRGLTPFVVVLTDGRANIARDGAQGRPRAMEDALATARALRAAGLGALVVDTGARPRGEAAALAEAMGARFLALPRADARQLSRAARAAAGER